MLDRVAYPNLEPLACLAAAAAVTERIGLMTNVLLAPLHSNLAKRASTIDTIAGGGRLTLGVGVGGRRDDYEASGVEFARRGRLLDAQLESLTVPVLVGGRSDAAFRRAARCAGWAAGGGDAARFAEGLAKLRAVWEREEPPRTTALTYFALGTGTAALDAYYAYSSSGPPWAATDEDAVRGAIVSFTAAGADELILFPASYDLAQVERLASVAL